MIAIGEPAPTFRLPATDGTDFQLGDQRGDRLLLVFYPGDDTPVCTRQLCDYRDGIEAFRDLGVRVVGISPDGIEKHRQFKQRHSLPFPLLSDPDLEVAEAYGARGILGMKRAVFLLDEDGIIRYAHIEPVALFRRRREELLDAIREMDAADSPKHG